VSTQKSATEYDVQAAVGNARGDGGIPHAQLLADYAEAIALRDEPRTVALRDDVAKNLGEAAMIDAAAVAASFHGFVRIADSTGLTGEMAGGGQVPEAFRQALGINDFYRAVNR
jgi:hypothetical protein